MRSLFQKGSLGSFWSISPLAKIGHNKTYHNTFGEISKKFRQKASLKALNTQISSKFGCLPFTIPVRANNFGHIANFDDFGHKRSRPSLPLVPRAFKGQID